MYPSVAHTLLDIDAVKLSPKDPFTWASGIKSPIYCDNRQILGNVEAHRKVIELLIEQLAQFEEADVIVGTATAGIPHATLIADRRHAAPRQRSNLSRLLKLSLRLLQHVCH